MPFERWGDVENSLYGVRFEAGRRTLEAPGSSRKLERAAADERVA
jgi:hypothetical protein